MLISSPNDKFIKLLFEKLSKLDSILFGMLSYSILNISKFRLNLDKIRHVRTSTPIIIRIPKAKLDNLNLDFKKSYSYFYWRKDFPIEIFFEQLSQNINRKYYKSYGKDPTSSLKFEWFSLQKQISTKLQIHNESHIVIGSLWEFVIDETVDDDFLEFCVETGLGERNTMGYGFINPV
jgi:CRISPR-associated endoribonuclease Cas6